MNRLTIIVLLVIAFIIGKNYNTIINYIKEDTKKNLKIEYCYNYYKGERWTQCPYYNDIKDLNK